VSLDFTDFRLTPTDGIKAVLADLRERKVFRSALAYAVVAWVMVQIADIVLPAFAAPPWVLQMLITLLVLGLPLTVFLAWLYDLTPAGVVKRTTAPGASALSARSRLAAAAFAFLLTGAAVYWLWTSYFVAAQRPVITRIAPPPQPVLAVPAFVNLAGDTSLDWLGEGLATLLRDGLAESKHLIVVSPSRWGSIMRAAGADTDPLVHAATAGIDYVVAGEILKTPAGLVLTTRLTDLAHGVELQAQRYTGETAQALLGSAESLVLQVKSALQVPHTEQVDWFAADFAVDNMSAYEAYLAGLEYFLNFDYSEAERAFRAALALAPDYHIARYRLAQVLAATGRTESASDTLAEIPPDAQLSERERAYVTGASALFARDTGRAIEIFSANLEHYPYDVEGRLLLAQAYDLAYDDAAALAELERLAKQEPENERIWSFIGETNLRLGELPAARDALDHYLALAPDDPYGFTILGQIALATREIDTAVGRLEHALELDPDFPRARFALAQARALGGETVRADQLLLALVDDAEAPPGDRIDAAFDLAFVRRAAGRFADAIAPLTRLDALIDAEQIRAAMALSTRAQAHIELAQLETAQRLIDAAIGKSPGVPTRYLFARGLLELAEHDSKAVRSTADEIRSHALAPDDPDRTEDKAAAYLAGMASLLDGDAAAAVSALRRSVTLSGYAYDCYPLGLARALLAAGELDDALETVLHAQSDYDPTEIRLDLELGRVRAILLEAEIRAARGEAAEAARRAQLFLARFAGAPRTRDEIERAERLVSLAN
jgi:tetratricopeptide (TPR) repeat protein